MGGKVLWPFVVGGICCTLALIFFLSIGFGMNLFTALPSIPKVAFTAQMCAVGGCNASGILDTDAYASYTFLTQKPYSLSFTSIDPSLIANLCVSKDPQYADSPCTPLTNTTFTLCCASNIAVRRVNKTTTEYSITFVTSDLNQGTVCLGCSVSSTVGWIALILTVLFCLLFGAIFCFIGCCCLPREARRM